MNALLSASAVAAFRRANCFSFLRYFFALSLFVFHFCTLTDTPHWWPVLGGHCVKAFFTLSGTLVFFSLATKPNLRAYAGKRVRRIVPAYVLAVLLGWALGAVLTTLPLHTYLTESATWRYLAANLSFLNFLQPTLPGVFQDTPVAAVNGSLWTMKVELLFYITMPAVCCLMRRYNRHAVLWTAYALCLAYHVGFNALYAHTGNALYYHLRLQLGSFTYFYAGALVLLYFDTFLRLRRYLLPLAAVLYLGQAWLPALAWLEPLTYAALLVGLAYSLPALNALNRYDNVTYGIFLYHHPLIQAVVCLGVAARSLPLAFALSLLLTVALSLLSWYGVEKRLLRRGR